MLRKTCVAMAAALALTGAGGEAWAHRMMAVSRVRDDGTVLLQAFFPDGKPARQVRAEVRRPDGSLFMEARTDEGGKLTVTPDGAAGLWTATFVGSMGHQIETSFDIEGVVAEKPRAAPPEASQSPTPAVSTEQETLIRREPFPWTNCLAGLGFILGLAAFLMCLKLRSELRRLRGQGNRRASADA